MVDLRAELLSEGVLTLDGLRWSDGTAWCELQSASGPGPAALNIRFLWATECGKGYGTALLKKIIRVADRLGTMLYLEVNPFWKKREGGGWCFETVREGGLSRAQLEAWYQKYGFEKINGSAMVREANAPAQHY